MGWQRLSRKTDIVQSVNTSVCLEYSGSMLMSSSAVEDMDFLAKFSK